MNEYETNLLIELTSTLKRIETLLQERLPKSSKEQWQDEIKDQAICAQIIEMLEKGPIKFETPDDK